ncbi:MAG: hypothetical protein LLG97_16005 [Deltaproteobacteria bacterium]|nr:hypothetical protein [Deltaproteobacteria bacterium]
MKLQETGIGVKKINAIVSPGDEHPERLIGGGAGSPTCPKQRAAKSTTDQEYVRTMEERYGIREEGIF